MNSLANIEARLVGRRLVAARVAWILFALVLASFWIAGVAAVFVASPTASLNPVKVQGLQAMGLSLEFYKAWGILIQLLFPFMWAGIGLLIFLRKSNDRGALLISAMMIGVGMAASIPIWQAFAGAYPDWIWAVPVLAFVGNVCINSFFSVFPTGHFVPRWAIALAPVFAAYNILNSYRFALPSSLVALGNAAEWFLPIFWIASLALYILVPFYRYRWVSTPLERQQIKWVVFTIAFTFIVFAAGAVTVIFVPGNNPDMDINLITVFVQPLAWAGSLALIPLSIGISILRFRLFDIYLIIRRTLIYSILTAILLLFYFGSVIVLQQLFRSLTGAGDDLAIIVSTLAIAALFVPLRNRVQRAIDHRFYRRKYDAGQVLATFAATVRDEVDLGRLTDELQTVVEETMQPVSVSVWLTKTGATRGGGRDGK